MLDEGFSSVNDQVLQLKNISDYLIYDINYCGQLLEYSACSDLGRLTVRV